MSIIEKFGLRKPIFSGTAAYGHFGREDIQYPWERLDMVDIIKKKTAEYLWWVNNINIRFDK